MCVRTCVDGCFGTEHDLGWRTSLEGLVGWTADWRIQVVTVTEEGCESGTTGKKERGATPGLSTFKVLMTLLVSFLL